MASKQEAKGKQDSAAKDDEKQKESAQKAGKSAQKNGESGSKSNKEEPAAKKSKQDNSDAEDEPEIDEAKELDALLEMLEGEDDLTEIDPEAAIEMIDEWQELIGKSKDENLKEINNGLKQLKKQLSNDKAKATDIAEVLSQLGEHVDTYANDAERGYKTKLHKLGKTLTKASKSLETEEEEE
jgi:hypothetical protein